MNKFNIGDIVRPITERKDKVGVVYDTLYRISVRFSETSGHYNPSELELINKNKTISEIEETLKFDNSVNIIKQPIAIIIKNGVEIKCFTTEAIETILKNNS